MRFNATILAVALAGAGWGFLAAQEQLPVPKKVRAIPKAAPFAEEVAEAEAEPVVVGNLEHQGWVLSGPRGRHYFFGGLAIADYAMQGERRIVTLQQEEPTLLPKPDPHFLYYRELQSGNRWAIAREPLSDGTYVVYFQQKKSLGEAASSATSAPVTTTDISKAWKVFQRARLEWKATDGAAKSK
ncbi:MAG: hypothetical protein ACKVP0_20400 [Pirellulaceae bacterium]